MTRKNRFGLIALIALSLGIGGGLWLIADTVEPISPGEIKEKQEVRAAYGTVTAQVCGTIGEPLRDLFNYFRVVPGYTVGTQARAESNAAYHVDHHQVRGPVIAVAAKTGQAGATL